MSGSFFRSISEGAFGGPRIWLFSSGVLSGPRPDKPHDFVAVSDNFSLKKIEIFDEITVKNKLKLAALRNGAEKVTNRPLG